MNSRHRWLVVLLCAAVASPAAGAALRDRVERRAADVARAHVPAPDTFEVSAVRFAGANVSGADLAVLETLEVDGPNASGMIRVRFAVRLDGQVRGEARATVRGTVRGPVLVAARALPMGSPVHAADVEVTEADLTRLTARPLRDPAELLGRVPSRTLGAGRVLTATLLRAESLVRRGDPVDLRLIRGALTVTAKGVARRDGAAGETVLAENLANGARVLGRVQPDGSLLVVHGVTSGRQR